MFDSFCNTKALFTYLYTFNADCGILAASFESEVCQGGWQGTFPVHDAVEVRQCEFGNGYPRCSDYDCDDFFSAWGECNRFCSGGNESRTYMVPSGDPEAAKYDSEVHRRGWCSCTPWFHCLKLRSERCMTPLSSQVCQVVALDMPREIAYPVNGSSVTRPCELGGGYPRCNAFDCNDFFTEWTACNRVCFGGNQSRRFIVPADDPVAQRYNTEARSFFCKSGFTKSAHCIGADFRKGIGSRRCSPAGLPSTRTRGCARVLPPKRHDRNSQLRGSGGGRCLP